MPQVPLGLSLYAPWASTWGSLEVGWPLCSGGSRSVYHVTWLVNSATRAFGYRNFDSPDLSRNCWWAALLSFGEDWHNNHHAYPASARHGLRWFELDITWAHLRVLRACRLARRVRLAPSPR